MFLPNRLLVGSTLLYGSPIFDVYFLSFKHKVLAINGNIDSKSEYRKPMSLRLFIWINSLCKLKDLTCYNNNLRFHYFLLEKRYRLPAYLFFKIVLFKNIEPKVNALCFLNN